MSLLSRRELLREAATGAAGGALLCGAPPVWGLPISPPFELRIDSLIPASDDPGQWPAFREALARWRQETARRLAYDDALYRRPDMGWVSSCFCCGFLMLYDEALYDRARGRWRLREFLREQAREFGGYDAVVLWHAYPRIGLDDRNQFGYYRDMPGGLAGLRRVVDGLHREGVRAFVDYNPWDTGTRREPASDVGSLAALVKAIGADGIFLDTMSQGAAELRAKLDAVRPGVALEGEIALPIERIHDHPMSWAQGFGDSRVPGVLRNKWFERRHMQHQIDRWSHDHTLELQEAWMNGSGMMVWENVFGSWVGWCARDRSVLRAMLPIQRRYARLFSGEGWTPLVRVEAPGVYAGLWEGDGLRLWTLANREARPVEGPLLRAAGSPGARWFDLFAGGEAKVRDTADGVIVSGRMGARSIGAILCGAPRALGPDFRRFLYGQARLAARASEDTFSPPRQVTLRLADAAPMNAGKLPPGMTQIPGGRHTFRTTFRVRECGFTDSRPPWEVGRYGLHGQATFERSLDVRPYSLDITPVTNAQYAAFLRATGYSPRHREGFLRHWANGRPPAGREVHPVVCVDLDDARAYARWAGKRLPTEEEWQLAAEGPEGLAYPWGAELEAGHCNGGETGGTTPVIAFPRGASPYGCLDMCGNVWEWTESERSDGRTRFALLKGGSYYRARGSDWYFDSGPQTNQFAAKMLLLWPGIDRCATIGFRCAVDVAAA